MTASLSKLSETDFENLGASYVAYIAEDKEAPGHYAIYSGNGKQIGSSPSIDMAKALLTQNDLKLVMLH